MTVEDARSFEDLKSRLDEIVSLVSDETLPMDDALALYEEAVGLGLQASRIMEEGIAEKQGESPSDSLATSDSQPSTEA